MVSSSSSSPRTWRYNVFTSFHGPDVRKTLLSHLRKQFSYNGITMFDDQGIERSQTIGPALIEAIRESRISIIVLSKNYASSSWCLDELLEILKCKEGIGQIVMTVFYGVDPSDVRKQTGDFGIAFNETCALKIEEQSQKWIQALTDVGNIAGEDFQNWDNEAEMIEKIARDVSYKLNATPSRDFDGMVGLDDHLKEMESLLDLDNVGVKIVGISGPAGIGKSTIARALHSRLSNRFQHTCFVENLRKNYETGLDEYGRKLRLHEHLFSKILNLTSISICHLGVIQERLHDKKVLIILDDVESVNQLEVLANIRWYGPGSRVIVTTKNKVILLQHDINDIYHVGFPCLGLRIIPDIPTNITSFSVPNTKLEELPASLIYCCRLEEVDISGSVNLKTFSTHLPTSVRELDLSNSGIERITDCIKGLRKLQDLNLSGCKGLESLPELPGSLKWLVAIDCESLERVSDPLNTPKTKLYFTNCFNLDREARQSIIHQSVGRGWAVIPGREVPAEYDHRARGNSLAIPHSSSNIYKVCLVILPKQHQPENISSTLSYRCKVINNLENSLDVEFLLEDVSMFQTEHLFLFHPRLPFIDTSEVNRKIVLEFGSKDQDFDIIECGVQILADETNGSSKVGFGDEDDISKSLGFR